MQIRSGLDSFILICLSFVDWCTTVYSSACEMIRSARFEPKLVMRLALLAFAVIATPLHAAGWASAPVLVFTVVTALVLALVGAAFCEWVISVQVLLTGDATDPDGPAFPSLTFALPVALVVWVLLIWFQPESMGLNALIGMCVIVPALQTSRASSSMTLLLVTGVLIAFFIMGAVAAAVPWAEYDDEITMILTMCFVVATSMIAATIACIAQPRPN